MTLINVLKGEDFGYDPMALDGFSTTPLWFPPGDVRPTLALRQPEDLGRRSLGFNAYVTRLAGYPGNDVDPVSAVLMHNNVYNEFVLDASTKSGTDWVVTFPTKRDYVVAGRATTPEAVPAQLHGDRLVRRRRWSRSTTAKSARSSTPGSFSPPPPTQTDSICWEANVITFNNTNVLGSKNFANIADDVRERLGLAQLPADRHGRFTLTASSADGGASTVFNTTTGRADRGDPR